MNSVSEESKIVILDKTLKLGFAQIPMSVMTARGLSGWAIKAYGLLLYYAWQKGSCFPGQEKLAFDMGVHSNTVRKYLKELKDFGLITWKRRGLNKTNIYYILELPGLEQGQFLLKGLKVANLSKPDQQDLVVPEQQDTSDQVQQQDVGLIEEDGYKKNKYIKSVNNGSFKNRSSKFTTSQSLEVPTNVATSIPSKQGTLGSSFKALKVPEGSDLSTFNDEALYIAKELNDLEDIKYYQKLISRRDKGEITDNDIQATFIHVTNLLKIDKADNKHFWKNPGAMFNHFLTERLNKKAKEQILNNIHALAEKKPIPEQKLNFNEARNKALEQLKTIIEDEKS